MTWRIRFFGASRSVPQNRLAGRGPSRTPSKRRAGRLLALETLEDRTLLSFMAPLNYDTGKLPSDIVTADFRGVGNLDIATTNIGSDNVSVLLGNGDGSFQNARNYAVGPIPKAIAVGDLRHTGRLDLVTGSYDGTLSVLLGNGDGTFQVHRDYQIGFFITAVIVADVNGDGQLDLIASNSNNVSVLLGHGDGTFGTPITTALNDSAFSVAAGDFNGDGHADLLVVSGSGSTSVKVLLGNGDGTFHPGASYSIGDGSENPQALAVADFNGDGNLDFGVATYNNVRVFTGSGDGTFQPAGTYDGSIGHAPLAVADINGDHQLDLIAASDQGVVGLLGNGDGTFRPPVTLAPGYFPYGGIAVGDFAGNGQLDLALGNAVGYSLGSSATVLLNNGDGTFPVAPGPGAAAVADLNGDGNLDLVGTSFQINGGVIVRLGNGDGTFAAPVNYFARNAFSVVVADVNGDGIPDIIATGPGYRGSGNTVSVLLGNGDGTFQDAVEYNVGQAPTSVTVGDFNGDGALDLVVTNGPVFPGTSSTTVSVLLGNGDGSFQPAVTYTVGANPDTIAVADLNSDGLPDLLVGYQGDRTHPGGVCLLAGNGDGTFQDAVTLADGFRVTAVAVGDFNNDGQTDFLAADASNGQLQLFLGNGDGTFQTPRFTPVGANPVAFALGDFNGDGQMELAVAGGFGVRLLGVNGDGTFQTPTISYGPSANLVMAGDINNDGRLDLITDIVVLLNQGGAAPGPVGGGGKDGGIALAPVNLASALSLHQTPNAEPAASREAHSILDNTNGDRFLGVTLAENQTVGKNRSEQPLSSQARVGGRWEGRNIDRSLLEEAFAGLVLD